MSGRWCTSSISSTSRPTPGWRSEAKCSDGGAARAATPGCCSSSAIALRTSDGFGGGTRARVPARARGHVRVRRARACADAGQFGQALLHQVAERAVGNLRQQRLGAFGQARPCLRACQVHVDAPVESKKNSRQRRRLLQARVETVARLPCARCVSGILAFGQEQEERLAAVLHARQHRLDRLPRGAAAGAVAVEAEEHVGARCGTAVRRGRAWSRCRAWPPPASRRTGTARPRPCSPRPRSAARSCCAPAAPATGRTARGPCGTAAVSGELRYFGPSSLIEHAAAEGDHAAAAVVDREHHPVAELVVDVAACRSSRTCRRVRAAACGAGRCRAHRAAR